MKPRLLRLALALSFVAGRAGAAEAAPRAFERDFAAPPAAARPYVWWHWLGTNINRDGIRRDLEAMKEMGVAGATICAVGSTAGNQHTEIGNSPWPEAHYWSPVWWALVKYATEEGGRLGLDIGMHNCAGWSASGGPWITPELSMQQLVFTTTPVTGGRDVAVALPRPAVDPRWNFYRDVAALAVPAEGTPAATDVIDLTARMDATGQLAWTAPAGNWVVYRFGHTTTGAMSHPAPDGVEVLECDKLSAAAATWHLQHVLAGLRENLGPLVGTSFRHLLFDSYEAGAQNWTADFRAQFQQRRGYDPLPWLPVLAGRKIGGEALAARFEWDMKQTIAELFDTENFATFARLLQGTGVAMCFEPYTGPFDTIAATARCDVPMTEFWAGENINVSRRPVSLAAQSAGFRIVGAEAFSGNPLRTQWNEDPALLKPSADGALAIGVNRFYLHEWALQPFGDNALPGLTLGWWGTHFGRNQTWFHQGRAWFDYLARSAALLQRGAVVSDLCTLEFPLPGADALSFRQFFASTVEAGKIVVPGGRHYAALALPDSREMLPEVAAKLEQLVAAGLWVVGPRPERSPSLQNYPGADGEVARLAAVLWGDANGKNITEHSHGAGKIFWGPTAAEVLARRGLDADVRFAAADARSLRQIHRREGDADIYFVANVGHEPVAANPSFRVAGKIPELWSALTGAHAPAAQWRETGGRTEVPLRLGAAESMFVVFRDASAGANPVVAFSAPAGAEADDVRSSLAMAGPALQLRATANGSYSVTRASGRRATITVTDLPAPLPVTGPWTLKFAQGGGAPESVTLPELTSWTEATAPGVKYFSGTAVYTKDFPLTAAQLGAGRRVVLDLGRVKNLAEVTVNGANLGVLWTPPFLLDVTSSVHAGANHLEIAVTNTWRNRLIGDEQEPADIAWGPPLPYHQTSPAGAPLAAFPDWLVHGKPRPVPARLTFTTWNFFSKDSALLESGLLGPVWLRFEVDLPVNVATTLARH